MKNKEVIIRTADFTQRIIVLFTAVLTLFIFSQMFHKLELLALAFILLSSIIIKGVLDFSR